MQLQSTEFIRSCVSPQQSNGQYHMYMMIPPRRYWTPSVILSLMKSGEESCASDQKASETPSAPTNASKQKQKNHATYRSATGSVFNLPFQEFLQKTPLYSLLFTLIHLLNCMNMSIYPEYSMHATMIMFLGSLGT